MHLVELSPDQVEAGDLVITVLGVGSLAGTRTGESTILHTELAVDVCEIPFHRGKREEEVVSNFEIGTFLGDQRQDFLLSLRSSTRGSPACVTWSAASFQQ